jgi:DNA polymerase-1
MDALSLFDVPPDGAATARVPTAPVPSPTAGRVAPQPPAGPTLLAVDGNSLAHRAFHAYGAPQAGVAPDRDGLYGFLALLAAVCDIAAPEAIVVGFDCRQDSERRAVYPGYKANRVEKDPGLYELLDEIPTVLVELGVEVVVAPGWEADDVIGSAAATAEAAGWRCIVATSDRDAFGLISDRTSVLRLRSGMENAVVVDPERLRRDMGVAPGQYGDFAALRGDTSDNLEGIRGIGPSRAAALLATYDDVLAAVADPIGCRSVLGSSLGQALIDDVASPDSVFRRNVALMTMRRDLPIDLDACRRRPSPSRIADCLQAWGVRGVEARLCLALGARPDVAPPPEAPPV